MSAIGDTTRPTIAERYGSASETSDLRLRDDRRTDADVLLAAAYASRGDRRGMIALATYRMKLTGDRHGIAQVVEEAMGWLIGRGARSGGKAKLGRPEARHISETVLRWWLDDVCRRCHGRRYELVPGTQIVSDNLCHTCHGTGKRPLEHMLDKKRVDSGRWLAAELDSLTSYIVADMAGVLNERLSVFLDPLPRQGPV